MNYIVLSNQLPEADDLPAPTYDEVKSALEIIKRSSVLRLDDDLSGSIRSYRADLNRSYPEQFVPDAAYKASMPDLQNGPSSLIKGAKTEIQHVGISNFRLPLKWQTRAGGQLVLETSVTGSVSLEASKKGINMSRIMRSFYSHSDEPFDLARIDRVLKGYLDDLESLDARLQLSFRYPLLKRSLRSNLDGFQYYDVAVEVIRHGPETTGIIHFDYVYSSTCPCSLELSEHARKSRGQIATPHSQRSVARISAVIKNGQSLWTEDLVELCVAAIPTETQVMVKREDEQAFAELNASNPIFVEDAVRLICEGLEREDRVGDFRVVASHQESLHSHDAVSILTSGPTFQQVSYDHRMFASLYHIG
ncbi:MULTISPECIES: GTP cyclohydrolase FolE2 [unclassified Falsihalocynthiibacter]|uniref:GTP cyclohydrolase FolE2 n=1 Tax=unclassified Falsihalocynthiibacter TaxID=2854191 RepID=UPI00350F82B1